MSWAVPDDPDARALSQGHGPMPTPTLNFLPRTVAVGFGLIVLGWLAALRMRRSLTEARTAKRGIPEAPAPG